MAPKAAAAIVGCHEELSHRIDKPARDSCRPLASVIQYVYDGGTDGGAIMIKFKFNESKALEVLVHIAQAWPEITPFYLSKVVFFADRDHLRKYGRPVTGDTYIAMDNGPVPSQIYDIVKGKLDFFGAPDKITEALEIKRSNKQGSYHKVRAKRPPNMDLMSETDIEELNNSIKFCRHQKFGDLSDLTHQEPAWFLAIPNSEMNLELLVPEDMREEVREAAAYTVL